MRPPAFWLKPDRGAFAGLLTPLAALYGAVAGQRLRRSGISLDVPVICVGNFTAGGTGKTPVVLALTRMLQDRGLRPAILSRGFGRASKGVVKVDPRQHSARDTGDEPLLLAERAPTFVAADRVAAAAAALREGADVLVMDDGLQNRGLVKSLGICVIDAAVGFGNGCVIPAGPLRARLEAQWPLVEAVMIVGEGVDRVAQLAHAQGKSVLRAALRPDAAARAEIKGRRLFAFAGIGRPEKFFTTLREAGGELVARRSFDDHHAFADHEIAGLRAAAQAQNAQLVTTTKDFARLSARQRQDIMVLPVELVFKEPEAINALLAAHLR
ncbi:MAG: tetraacyldisaccharide 4'-kinase [Hyphomicrobiales bacterium]|nr:tetraacyldisaccharide 4'-kinase [Hyphomicrobiales bacterium]